MENETTNEFLKELDNKDESGFDSQDGNPFELEAEQSAEPEVAADDKPLPFNKDPKIQRYIEKQIAKALEEIKPTETQQFLKDTGETEDEVTAVLERIIGNDTMEKVTAIKDFKKVLGSLEEKGAQRALQQLREQEDAKRRAEAETTREIEEGLESIEDKFNIDLSSNSPIARKTKNDFLEFAKKLSPKDSEGKVIALPDLPTTFELFQETRKKPDNSRAKELASRSMERSGTASTATPQKPVTWDNVTEFLSKLSN